MPDVYLSIIIAARDAAKSFPACLETILAGVAGVDAEVIVVAPAGSWEAGQATGQARVITVPGDPLVPELWRTGILASTGTWVAVTTAQCVPDGRWVGALLASLDDGIAAVGGAFECASRSPAEQAVFLLRYSPYLLPFARHGVDDIPGDNAVYRRTAINAVAESWTEGFWENEVNAVMAQRGAAMLIDPRPVVRHRYTGGVLTFCQQRFRHGRVFGAWRSGGTPRLGRVATAPLVPFAFLARIWRRTAGRPSYRRMLLTSLPWLCLYLLFWTGGEALGYLTARRA